MNSAELIHTARALVAPGKGLLAMDESNPTCNKRFAALGIPQTAEARQAYRDLIVTTPHLGDFISGAILFDETVGQKTMKGDSFIDALQTANIIPGIKVDLGTTDMAAFPGEKVTEGLDGLRSRLRRYRAAGLLFAKWRAVIAIGDGLPTDCCIHANMHALARYAALCQEAEVVPIVEPEVLMEGNHTLKQCLVITEKVQHSLFDQLYMQRVDFQGLLLKPNMVLPGTVCPEQNHVDEVANATVTCLLHTVPAAVPGVAFLSGGQSARLASERLNTMNVQFKGRMPWALTFSFSRAIQQPALDLWKGRPENVMAAQKALLHRASCNGRARQGLYNPDMELSPKT